MKTMFELGRVVMTHGAREAMSEAENPPIFFLAKHVSGDWGDLDYHDQLANNRAVNDGSRILSAYHTSKGVKLWVITEADRSSTCILLPSEY